MARQRIKIWSGERWQQNNLGSNGRFPDASGISPHCTAISHDDVCYLEQYRSLSRQEVDDSIMPLLMAEESQPFGTSAEKEKVSKQKKWGQGLAPIRAGKQCGKVDGWIHV